MIELPPNTELGDLAFPCFTLAKTLKKAPQVLASEVVSQVEGKLSAQFTKIHAVGPYVNVFLNTEEYMSVGKGNRIPNAVDKQKLIEDDEGPGVEMQ